MVASLRTQHLCHAPGCDHRVPPRMFACRDHWYALPKKHRDAIWAEYRPGQEADKRPSHRYLAVQLAACAVLAFKPGDEEAAFLVANLTLQARTHRNAAVAAGQGDPFLQLGKPWVDL